MPSDHDQPEPSAAEEADQELAERSTIGETPTDTAAPAGEAESDVRLADESTLHAPSYRSLMPKQPPEQQDFSVASSLEEGDVIDDFEVIKVLGKGAFGVVYLARQVSLDRQVALKIAANEGSEGRTMARLEHDHIVQVFSECVDDTGNLRLLCMQLVPGTSLEGVVTMLHRRGESRDQWTGQDYLAIVESRASTAALLDTSALHDREKIAGFDALQTTAWVGARLAEAVDFAHRQGVLHRDIKPANILVNQYGRPMLADFNISFRSVQEGGVAETAFGGTLAFMAPEHLEAFDPASRVTPREVNEQSDIYSLGIVIYELLTGQSPFAVPPRGDSRIEYVRAIAESRRTAAPPLKNDPPSARKTQLRTIAWSLAPNKADRPECAARFAAALDGCQELRTAEREMPAPTWLARSAWKKPFLWMLLLAVAPQVAGSVVNIAYNVTEIVSNLTAAQEQLFLHRLVPLYNLVAYPLLIAVWVAAAAPVYKMWKRLHGKQIVPEPEVAAARRRALSLPYWMLGIAAAGWLPGGIIFPVLLHTLLPDSLPTAVYAHFLTSFTLSGLIAVAYSFCGLQFIALRVLYPRMWADPTGFRQLARQELASTTLRLWLINFLSTAIPLVTIALFIVPPLVSLLLDGKETYEFPFVILALLVALLALGLFGREITTVATGRMARTYAILIRRQG